MLPILSIQNNFEYLQKCVPIIQVLLKDEKKEEILEIFNKLHSSSAALILQFLNTKQRKQILEFLDEEFNPEILNYLDETVQQEIINLLATNELAFMLTKLKESDATEILENLTKEQLKILLPSFNIKYRKSIEKVLNYPEDSAGKIMDHHIISVPEEWTVGQIKNFIRTAKTLPKNFNTIYLITKSGELSGKIELTDIIKLHKTFPIKNHKKPLEITFNVFSTFEELIFTFRTYKIHEAPILDDNNNLIGSISITTILEIMHEQAEENFLNAAGIDTSDFYQNIWQTSFSRLQWLIVTVLSSLAVALMNDNWIPKDGLGVYVTVIMATCGAAGIQVTTIIINALFSRELGSINLTKTTIKELTVAIINGIIFSILTSIALFTMKYKPSQIIRFNIVLISSLIISSIFGILLPLCMKKFGQDPNSGSSSILTSFTDSISVIMFIIISKIFF